MIFVFGSNIAGHHGAGAAKAALELHHAKYGQGMGLQGSSYGIPTKNEHIETLPLIEIQWHVNIFKAFAARNRDSYKFQVTRIGCGLAGYTDWQIAPMFEGAPRNCHMPPEWQKYFPEHPLWEFNVNRSNT